MAIDLSRLFEKIAFWRQPEDKKITFRRQLEEMSKPKETAEQKLHRRDSMLLDLLNLLKEISSLSDEQQIRNKFYDCRGLLTKLHPFAEKDADTASALLKAIDVLADIDLEQSIETLRLMAIDLGAYHQLLADNQMNRDLAKKCISLAEQTEFVDEKMAALAYAVEFAPSLSAEAAQVLENLINDMEPKDAIAFIGNKFSNEPGNRPAFEAVALAATRILSETLPPDQEMVAQRIIVTHTTDNAEQNKAAERWLFLLTSSISRDAAMQELERQVYDNHYTPKILRENGIRAQLLLANKAVGSLDKADLLMSAAYDRCKSGNENLSKLAAERWLECATDQDLISKANYGDRHIDKISRQRILDLAESRTPENAVRILDLAANACEQSSFFKQEKFYAQVTEKWAALLKEKLPVEQAYSHLRLAEGRRGNSIARRDSVMADVFLSLTDRLPLKIGVESAKYAVWIAETAEQKTLLLDAAQKWASLVRQLPPEEGLAAIKTVRGTCGELKRHADILERELCGKVACGIRPEEFLKQLSGGPG